MAWLFSEESVITKKKEYLLQLRVVFLRKREL